ncbi:ABC transporter permease [Alloalcanivorax marinus]|uniref:ABC transporter permease n=1 Tax=Alloalcanivorax marinus TaxID=1177169 RepID=UPI0019336E02|nr:ABC transporter permease [Alloalcanivorax marinus]MBL7251095.1 ABC transporter permease [Alloalcanivorax marinus]
MNTETRPSSDASMYAGRSASLSLSDWILPLFIVVTGLIAGIIQPQFFTGDNMLNLARQAVPLLILSLGQAVAIIRGGLDLSLASVMSFAGVAGTMVMIDQGMVMGIMTMLIASVLLGMVSGLIIAWFNTSPLVITLGMLSVAKALALILSGGVPLYDVPADFVDLIGFGSLLGVPNTVWIALLLTVLVTVLLRHTLFGRYVYAIGSNASAAAKSGVNVRFYTVLVYMVSGFCAGVGAVVLTAWTSSAQPVAAPNLTLQSLAAVVLGGVALTGGAGGIRQVFIGVLVLTLLSNVMNMIGVSAYYQTLAVGVVIILAVILDRFRRTDDHH